MPLKFGTNLAQLFDQMVANQKVFLAQFKNIFESDKPNENAVVSKMETTAADDKLYQINSYNLDAIFF